MSRLLQLPADKLARLQLKRAIELGDKLRATNREIFLKDLFLAENIAMFVFNGRCPVLRAAGKDQSMASQY